MAKKQRLKRLDLGIDLTANEMRAVALSRRGKNLVLENFIIAEIPSAVFAAGRVADPKTLGERIKAILLEHGIKGRRVKLSLSGKASITRRIELPAMSMARIRQAIRLQIGQYVPFPPADTSYDFAIVPKQKRMVQAGQTEVLLSATRKSTIDSLMETLRYAGLEPAGIEVTALAAGDMLIEAVSPDYQQSVCFIDMRDSVTELTFYTGHYFKLTRTIEIGYNTIINRVSQDLEVSPEQAESFLEEEQIDLSLPEEEVGTSEDTRLREAILGVLSNFVSELIRSIRYFEGQVGRQARVGKLFIYGNIGLLRNLDRFLEEQTGLETSRVALSQFVDFKQGEYSIELLNRNAEKLITATALARTFYVKKKALDLLPQVYRTKAQYRYVASGLLLILLAMGWLLYNQQRQLEEQISDLNAQLQQLTSQIAKYENDAKAYDQTKQEVNQLLPKFDEIMSIANSQVPIPVIMTEVGRRTPDGLIVGTVITDLGTKTVTIQGCALGEDFPLLQLYVLLIDDSPFFTNTQFGARTADQCGGGGAGGGGGLGAGGAGGGGIGIGGLNRATPGQVFSGSIASSGPKLGVVQGLDRMYRYIRQPRLNYNEAGVDPMQGFQFPGFGARPGAAIESFFREQRELVPVGVWEFQITTTISDEVIKLGSQNLEDFKKEIEDVLKT